jgi:hypothetical protein
MHASTAQAAAKTAQQPKQDLRTPDARDAALSHNSIGHGVNAPGATAVGSASELPPAGQPAWPVDPSPIVAPAAEPVSDGDGVPVIPLVAGGLLVLVAAFSARPLARHMARRAPVA